MRRKRTSHAQMKAWRTLDTGRASRVGPAGVANSGMDPFLGPGWFPTDSGRRLPTITIRELVPSEDSLRPDEQYTMFHPSEVELSETTKNLCHTKPRRPGSRVMRWSAWTGRRPCPSRHRQHEPQRTPG